MGSRGMKRTDGFPQRKVPVGVLHFRYRERRRHMRVTLTLPVIAHGVNDQGENLRALRNAFHHKQGANWSWMSRLSPARIFVGHRTTNRDPVDLGGVRCPKILAGDKRLILTSWAPCLLMERVAAAHARIFSPWSFTPWAMNRQSQGNAQCAAALAITKV